MRESWRALRFLVATTVREEPWRALGSLLEPLSRLSFPLVAVWLKFLTDGIVQRDVSLVVAGVVGLAVVQSTLGIAGIFGNDLRIILSERIGFAIDREVATIAAALPGMEHHERPDYQDRLELLRRNQAALANSLNSLLNALNAVVGAAGALVVLLYLSPWLLFVVLFAVPAIPIARLQQKWQRAGEEESATPSRLARHLRGLTVDRDAGMEFRVFGLQDEIRRRFRLAWRAAREPVLRAERRTAWTNIARQAVFAIGYVAAVVLVLWRAVQGQATAGDVVATIFICQQVATMVVWPVFSLARLGPLLRAAGRMLWLRDYADTEAAKRTGSLEPPAALREGITFESVSFAYPGTDRLVLQDVSLTIPAGSVVALVGENGAGKTTLVKLLTRMYEPAGGRILVDGVDLAEISVVEWRSRLSAAFQDFAKLELVAQHAVGVGDLPRLDDASAVTGALQRAGASEVVPALPAGLSSQLGSSWPDGVDLSTGQWQKLALGRALLRSDPLVVFFDEPTASLDAPTEHALFERYASVARAGSTAGAITVLVSHRFSTVRTADLIVVVGDGGVTELGSHEELMSRGGLYAELYTLQARSYA
ncbi:ABC transporter ATP-binding protein [Flindersiella endophytica]